MSKVLQPFVEGRVSRAFFPYSLQTALTPAQYLPTNLPAALAPIFEIPHLTGVIILGVNRTTLSSLAISALPLLLPADITVPPICSITITLTHPGVNDTVTTEIWLPQSSWNGRLTALCSRGRATGHGQLTLGPAVTNGFAAVSTNAGVDADPSNPEKWALKEDGSADEGLLTNFVSRSVYDMTVLGKAVTESFYGKKPTTYWQGCSTGGRQGPVAAQQYPEIFDGILAGAPAICWPTYVIAELWSQVVMKDEGVYPSVEELIVMVAAAIETCAEADDVKDGVVAEPEKYDFDVLSLIKKIEITPEVARVVKRIWDGPVLDGQRLWYGFASW